MRLLFMGTPDFAVPSLTRLFTDGHEIVGVVCQPDRQKGRGMKWVFPPVKERAAAFSLPVWQPDRLQGEAFMTFLKSHRPELIAVVAYGKILPREVLAFPKCGCVNLHGSLLPAYRGAAPIQRAIMNGEKAIGVTTIQMNDTVDAGDMLLMEGTEAGEAETAGEAMARLSEIGARVLSDTIFKLEKGELMPEKQDESKATFAPMLKKEEGRIDWCLPAWKVKSLILGLDPWPSAFSSLADQEMKLFHATLAEGNTGETPGKVLGVHPGNGLLVACGDGRMVGIQEIQAAGKKRMRAADYMNGHPALLTERFL